MIRHMPVLENISHLDYSDIYSQNSSSQTVEDKMKKHYPVIIEQDKDGVYIVECPLFKGCRSYGHNIDGSG